MKWLKIGLLNVVVLLSLLVFAEVALRSVWTVRSCLKSECNFSRITKLKFRDFAPYLGTRNLGYIRYDDKLGYVPREGFDAIIELPYWNNSRVTITSEGFRLNSAVPQSRSSDILAVGDSFTFGDQVSNFETWPACLEKKLDRRVDNGGVFGYGAAQALQRASIILDEKHYSTLVFSVLVGWDFSRDRLSYRGGLAKPALVLTADGIEWSAVPDPNRKGTKFNPALELRPLLALYARSLAFKLVQDRLLKLTNFTGDVLEEVHPDAAPVGDIVKWTLREFSQIEVANKILLLQYPPTQKPDVMAERETILRIAGALQLTVVDTLNALSEYEPQLIWKAHHTAFGNEVVCDALVAGGFQ